MNHPFTAATWRKEHPDHAEGEDLPEDSGLEAFRLEEQELARQDHLSSMAAKPWDEVCPESVMPQRWDQKLPPAPWPSSQSQTGVCAAAGMSSSHMHMSE